MPMSDARSRQSNRLWIVLCAFLVIAGFFLLTEHRAHLFGLLPYLLLLACPLLHLFLHGGHRSHEAASRPGAEPLHHPDRGEGRDE